LGTDDVIYAPDRLIVEKLRYWVSKLGQRNLTAKEFFDSIYEMYIVAQSLDIPLEEFPYYVQGLGAKIETLTKDNRIIKKELEESKVRDQKLTQQLLKVGKERRKYKIDLARERGRAVDLWWVEEQELEKINEDFGYGSDMVINPSNLGDALMDVYYHPIRYGDIISKLMERSMPLSKSFRQSLSRKK
jgi:hypothetical protein